MQPDFFINPQSPAKENKKNLVQTDSLPNFICGICLNYLTKSTKTTCGHVFCQMCLTQYLLFFQKCVICSANIRNGKYLYSFLLDELVHEFIVTNHKEELEEYGKRMKAYSKWQETKKLGLIEVGRKIDVRDANYVWCIATITRLINRINEPNRLLRITYDNFDKKYDEDVDPGSSRVAPLGFYTSRPDIPRYFIKHHSKPNDKRQIICTLNKQLVLLRKDCNYESSSSESQAD